MNKRMQSTGNNIIKYVANAYGQIAELQTLESFRSGSGNNGSQLSYFFEPVLILPFS